MCSVFLRMEEWNRSVNVGINRVVWELSEQTQQRMLQILMAVRHSKNGV